MALQQVAPQTAAIAALAIVYALGGKSVPVGSAIVALCLVQAVSLLSPAATPQKKEAEAPAAAQTFASLALTLRGFVPRAAVFALGLLIAKVFVFLGFAGSWSHVASLACLFGALRRCMQELWQPADQLFGACSKSSGPCGDVRGPYTMDFWLSQAVADELEQKDDLAAAEAEVDFVQQGAGALAEVMLRNRQNEAEEEFLQSQADGLIEGGEAEWAFLAGLEEDEQ